MPFDYDVNAWVKFVQRVLIPGILVLALLFVLFYYTKDLNIIGEAGGSFFGAFSGGSGSVHL